MKKKISPVAINALKEALTNIYWYKNDLKSFLINVLGNKSSIININWDDYKRNIVHSLIDRMAAHQDKYQDELLSLMSETV